MSFKTFTDPTRQLKATPSHSFRDTLNNGYSDSNTGPSFRDALNNGFKGVNADNAPFRDNLNIGYKDSNFAAQSLRDALTNGYPDTNNRARQKQNLRVRFYGDGPDNCRDSQSEKHVTFPRQNMSVSVREFPPGDDGDYTTLRNPLNCTALAYLSSYGSLPRSVDSDGGTTTSGSYTLDSEDTDDIFSEA